MERIDHSFQNYFEKDRFRRRNIIQRSKVYHVYPQAVGRVIARATKIKGFKGGVLYIACRNSIYVTELSQMKQEMIERMNHLLEEPLIKEIRFFIANVRTPKAVPPKKKITAQQKAWIEKVVQSSPECYKEKVRKMLVAYKENK